MKHPFQADPEATDYCRCGAHSSQPDHFTLADCTLVPRDPQTGDWTMPARPNPSPGITTSRTLNDYAAEVHAANQKWWHDLETGEPIERNVGELLCLVHSEISEALEGHRKNLPDDKLPHRQMFEVELADAVIRILDICGGLGLDLEGAYREKMAFNAVREDHKRTHRLSPGGKKY